MKRDLYLDYLIRWNKDARITIRVVEAEQEFLEEVLFWNDLAKIINEYSVSEAHSLLCWVGNVLETNYPRCHNVD